MRIRFDRFVVDSETRELINETSPVPLSPKAFDLLLLLVEQRPRALAKTELYQHLWPASFVVDANLVNLIVEVRGALGDNPRTPRFIRTVHRFGYAFCGTATEGLAGPAPAADRPQSFMLTWRKGRVALADGAYEIGREAGASIKIPFQSVSRKHLTIAVANGLITIEDLGSKNGTFVKGERLTSPVTLTDGDTFVVGSVRVKFHVIKPTRSTRTVSARKN
jgi:DNA-binding winged helix-turn-helix (wHTH) protein